ncbi:hypothetical protein OOK41_18140 [Micromonospora sp. NBC_01655]|uniref:hypothetical protein n=1 Tax=Micromonospora sp. NBC_01655 TaxID=2975983 RepID=UPI00224F7D93|nr:hypothetical protein [Micromonospora sp. NBC_01655]MCX4472203.1 hypothetical protein [Micromonospora sp. NBC_01655]
MELDWTLDDLVMLSVVNGLEALTRPVRVIVYAPNAEPEIKASSKVNPALLSRLAAQCERHEVVWAPPDEPLNDDDNKRALELATREEAAAKERAMSLRGDNIVEALDKFLAEQRERRSKRAFANYRSVIELLLGCLNWRGYESLTDNSRQLYGAYDESREGGGGFCRLYGPEEIPGNIGGFLGSYVPKAILSQAARRAAGPVVRELGYWLTTRDYGITTADVQPMLEHADAAAYALPAAEKVQRRWNELCDAEREFGESEVEDAVEDFLFVSAVEPGLVRFAAYSPDRLIDVSVPQEISDLVKPGWEMYVEAALVEGEWCVSMIGTIYP